MLSWRGGRAARPDFMKMRARRPRSQGEVEWRIGDTTEQGGWKISAAARSDGGRRTIRLWTNLVFRGNAAAAAPDAAQLRPRCGRLRYRRGGLRARPPPRRGGARPRGGGGGGRGAR